MYHLSADYEKNEEVIAKGKTHEALIEAGFSQNNYTDARIEDMVRQLTTEDDIDRRIIKELVGKDKIRR